MCLPGPPRPFPLWIVLARTSTLAGHMATRFTESPVEFPERRASEDEARRIWYPDSEWGERVEGNRFFRCLRTLITPVPPTEEIFVILADLDRGRDVSVEPRGRLRHRLACQGPHQLRGSLEELTLEDQTFLVEATFYTMTEDPRGRILEPEVSRRIFPSHPHFYDIDIICPVFPPDRSWAWSTHLVTDYLNHVALWLIKSMVWRKTKVWIGPHICYHSPDHLLRVVHRSAPCPCGRGLTYGQCCRSKHITAGNQQPWYRRLHRRTRK